jgi:hypothetical protein
MAFNIFMLAGGRFLSLLPESMVRFSGKHLPLKVLPVDLPLRLRPPPDCYVKESDAQSRSKAVH